MSLFESSREYFKGSEELLLLANWSGETVFCLIFEKLHSYLACTVRTKKLFGEQKMEIRNPQKKKKLLLVQMWAENTSSRFFPFFIALICFLGAVASTRFVDAFKSTAKSEKKEPLGKSYYAF